MKRSLILLALGALLALPLWLAPAQVSAQGKTAVQSERTKLMRSNFGSFKKIGSAKDAASAIAAAKTIIKNVNMLRSKFPAGSHGGASRAKASIAGNMDDINKRLSAVEAGANNVIKVASSGNMGAIKAAAGAMIKNCGACHKAYRGPKKK